MSFFRRLYQFDYMGHKLWWFALSGIIIAVGLVSLAVNGLEFGLEFQEGTRITVAFETPPPLGELRAAVAEAGYPNAQIQQTANVSGSGVEGFQIQTPMLSAEQQVELRDDARRAVPDREFRGQAGLGRRDGERLVRQAGGELVAQGDGHRPAAHPGLRHVPLPVEVRGRARSPPRSTTS